MRNSYVLPPYSTVKVVSTWTVKSAATRHRLCKIIRPPQNRLQARGIDRAYRCRKKRKMVTDTIFPFCAFCGYFLVAIVRSLVRSFHRDADVTGLFRRELRQLHPEMIQVQACDLFIELLGQHVNLLLIFAAVLFQIELRKHLIRE